MSRDGASFQSVVSAAKEAELMLREDIGDPKRVHTSRQFSGALLGGKDMSRGGGLLHYRGLVHTPLPALEGGQGPHGSYSNRQGSSSFQQRPAGRGGYNIFPSILSVLFSLRSCYRYASPNYVIRYCPY